MLVATGGQPCLATENDYKYLKYIWSSVWSKVEPPSLQLLRLVLLFYQPGKFGLSTFGSETLRPLDDLKQEGELKAFCGVIYIFYAFA